MVILSWHLVSNFSVSLLQDIVKDPKFILGGATRTDICQGDLGEWFSPGGYVHVYTPEEQQQCPHTGGDVVPPKLVELEVLPRLTWPTATSWTFLSHPCQGQSWGSSIQDQGRIFTQGSCEPKGLFCPPAPPVCPGQAGTPSLGTHRLSFVFQGKWHLAIIISPLALFSPLFSIHRWLLAASSHSFSHIEWENASKSGANGPKFWARLCWNISLPGKVNICHRMNTSLSLHFMVYFAVRLPGTAEETLEKSRIAELTLLFMFWQTS